MPSNYSCSECGATGEIWDRGRYGMCVNCANAHDSADLYDDESDEYYGDIDEGYGNGIYSYDYKPSPQFFGGRDGWHMGIELEISASEFNVAPIYRWAETHGCAELFYVKEDGSVAGFEIVSHPMTREYFDSVPWDDFFGMLETHWPMRGRSEPNGHGLHVHVSRTAFPQTSTLARWSYMVNHYQDHVCRVARRTDSHWAQFTDIPVSLLLPYENNRRNGHYIQGDALSCGCCYERIWQQTPSARLTRQFQSRGYPERYQAVNLTNTHTVEVRVFRSTRVASEFVASVHFVAALVDFVRTMQPCHATIQSLAWETFTDFVVNHPVFAKDREILTGTSAASEAMQGIHAAAIREWARANGMDVGKRGRISADLRNSYMEMSV
jgi:hypothetical protein